MKTSWLFLLVVPLLTGCPHDEYVLELRPTDSGLERQLTCWREDRDTNGSIKRLEFPTNDLAEISSRYDRHRTLSNHTHVFNGLFHGALPNDLDGWGQYNCITSSLGNASLYMERFRGSTNLVGLLEDRLAAVDELTDLCLGWLQKELGKQKNYKSLHRVINSDLRKDFKEASLESAVGDESNETSLAFKLAVRGILTSIPSDGENPFELHQLRAFVSKRLGLTENPQTDARLGFLRNQETALHSLSNYLATTKQYKTLLKQWKADNEDGDPPDSTAILMPLAECAFTGSLKSSGPDQLKVKLYLPNEPVKSNGEWRETEGCLIWDFPLPDRSSDYSNIAEKSFAVWCKPNVEFQNKHFGKVALADDRLVQYCKWYATLTPAQQAEWDSMLTTLTPEHSEPLTSFRFSTDNPEGENGSLVDYARRLLKAKEENAK